MLAVSEGLWAALGVVSAAFFAAIASIYGAWKSTQVHREVRSPNGMPTANLTYEAWKAVTEVREQIAELREGQVEGWARAFRDTDRAEKDRVRLEGAVDDIRQTVDGIASEQQLHHQKDESRFRVIFGELGVADPTE